MFLLQNFTFCISWTLYEVTAGALLQLVEVPVKDSIVLHHTNDYAMFSVTCRFGKCALHLVIRVTNEDGKEHCPCYQSPRNAITNHLPVILWRVDHYNSKQIVCPASSLLCTPFIQPLSHHLTTMILWEIIMKAFLQSQNYNTMFPETAVSPQKVIRLVLQCLHVNLCWLFQITFLYFMCLHTAFIKTCSVNFLDTDWLLVLAVSEGGSNISFQAPQFCILPIQIPLKCTILLCTENFPSIQFHKIHFYRLDSHALWV